MPHLYVKPRPLDPKRPDAGTLQVRLENGKPIPAEGALVEHTPYIRRRLRDGDLVTAKPPTKPSRAKSTANADAGEKEA
ncbi:DUF2635 domain-containing protein [Billgrantia desiderata]|uniref:DUF2635 domain-containing protein n=1 Tax=Billgrantia desiderata TaxID=52021 RepID=UPI001F485C5C